MAAGIYFFKDGTRSFIEIKQTAFFIEMGE